MAQYHGDEMEYVADDNEMVEVEDDMYFRGRAFGETDSDDDDDDEYDLLVCFESLAKPLLPFEFESFILTGCLFISAVKPF